MLGLADLVAYEDQDNVEEDVKPTYIGRGGKLLSKIAENALSNEKSLKGHRLHQYKEVNGHQIQRCVEDSDCDERD